MTAAQHAHSPAPRRLHLSKEVTWTLVGVFVVLALITPFLPDYANYQAIYETDGGHLAVLGRDLGFVLLVQVLAPLVSYDVFRWLALVLVATLTLVSLRRLQAASPWRLGFSLVLAFVPLMLIKFGAQIREGMALCVWLSIVLGSARRPNPFLFLAAAVLSASIHAATTPLWALAALALYVRPRWERTAMILGVLLYGAFVYIVADVSRLEDELFGGLSDDTVRPGLFTVLYWLIFPGIFVVGLWQRETRIARHVAAPLPVRTLGFVVQAAMAGLLLGLTIQISLTGSAFFQKGAIADSMRLAGLVLALYCIFLAMRGKRRKAGMLALFLLVDTARIILAA